MIDSQGKNRAVRSVCVCVCVCGRRACSLVCYFLPLVLFQVDLPNKLVDFRYLGVSGGDRLARREAYSRCVCVCACVCVCVRVRACVAACVCMGMLSGVCVIFLCSF